MRGRLSAKELRVPSVQVGAARLTQCRRRLPVGRRTRTVLICEGDF